MMIDYTKSIASVTPWTLLKDMPTGKNSVVTAMKEQYNTEGYGVYQIIDSTDVKKIPEGVYVHADIGYTGLSGNVFSRVGAVKNKKHHPGKFLFQEKMDPLNEVHVRYLFVQPNKAKLVESSIHNETYSKFGHNFKWTKASGGLDGVSTGIISSLDKVENPSELINIIKKAEERWAYITLTAAKEGSLRDLLNDYFVEKETEDE